MSKRALFLAGLGGALYGAGILQLLIGLVQHLRPSVATLLAALLGAALASACAYWLRLSFTDDGTGLRNRRYLFERLAAELWWAQRTGAPLAFIVAEVDDMKRHNDTHGHLVGDDVLRTVAGVLRQGVRRGDLVGRWGGDEFGIILPRARPHEALALAERLLRLVAQLQLHTAAGQPVSMTISAKVRHWRWRAHRRWRAYWRIGARLTAPGADHPGSRASC
jgi:diguanylate cyclase (GGDEF)-like protein